MTEKELQKILQKPFDFSEIEWRVQSFIPYKDNYFVIMVPYVQARAIMTRLDEVFGVFGWSDEYSEYKNGVKCKITVNLNGKKISKEDGAEDTNIESLKGGISGAFKRCAVKFGIGRYLYTFETQILSYKKGEFEIKDNNGKPAFKKLTKQGEKKLKDYYLSKIKDLKFIS